MCARTCVCVSVCACMCACTCVVRHIDYAMNGECKVTQCNTTAHIHAFICISHY